MSISERASDSTDFPGWLVQEFSAAGEFTALVVLVDITDATITPLCSTYFNVVGAEVDWSDMVVMFAGSGADWSGAAFFPVRASGGGPLDNPTARVQLRQLEMRLDEDRLVLNEGHFFDKWGRRMHVDEVPS
ncbi:hypothetical protein [Bradyrhizobium sp.]|uniref:hypothetical protein n=1 Tax=Bradyrhizobium sp. TaxID=376 RepID=UPI0025B83EB4|nr:hypothetical protein [Bradyrhizobium sp.]